MLLWKGRTKGYGPFGTFDRSGSHGTFSVPWAFLQRDIEIDIEIKDALQ